MNSILCQVFLDPSSSPCNSISIHDWNVLGVSCAYKRSACPPTLEKICDSVTANGTATTCFPVVQGPARMDEFIDAAEARFSSQPTSGLTKVQSYYSADNCSDRITSQELYLLNACIDIPSLGLSKSYAANPQGVITQTLYRQSDCKPQNFVLEETLTNGCQGHAFYYKAPTDFLPDEAKLLIFERDTSCTTSTIIGHENDSICDPSKTPDICCVDGASYPGTDCSPSVDNENGTDAILTNNDFSEGGDGGGKSSCDKQFHDNSELVVALSTGWYAGGSRCGKLVDITVNGVTVSAKVVDECDSRNGCDSDHAFQKPCRTNVVDASKGVFDALNIDLGQTQELSITWKDHS